MPEEIKLDQDPKDEQKGFEVDELNDENLEGIAGGFEEDAEIKGSSPGNGCSNYASNC